MIKGIYTVQYALPLVKDVKCHHIIQRTALTEHGLFILGCNSGKHLFQPLEKTLLV